MAVPANDRLYPRRMLMAVPAADRANPAKNHQPTTLTKRVAAVQERARNEGFISDGTDDKPLMDEMWGEEN